MGYESAENHDEYEPPPPSPKMAKDLLVIVTTALIGVMLSVLLALGAGCAAIEKVGEHAGDAAEIVQDAGAVAKPIGYVYRFDSPAGSMCSAVAVSPSEAFVAAHCLEQMTLAEPYTMRHLGGEVLEVRVVESNEGADLALLELIAPDKRFPLFATIAKNPVSIGDPVVSIGWGCLKGTAPLVSPGLVTFVMPGGPIVVGVKICKGDSGGGLFNRAGELVGLTSMSGEQGGFPSGLFVHLAGEF